MQKNNIHTAKEKYINNNYFTGKVIIREVLGEGNSAEQEMYHVTFHNGALTTLHYHESDQIIIATKGRGVVGLVKGPTMSKSEVDIDSVTFLHEGDTVCIPANIVHFHGALNGGDLSHIAIMKMDKLDRDKKIRSATKWEYALLREENPNKKENMEKFITTSQREIRRRIQMGISMKLTSQNINETNKPES